MGTSLSTASCDAPQAAPPLQQQQASSKASRQADPTPAIRSADSVSSFGGSNMEADHELKQQQQQQQHKQQQPGRSKLLALLRDRLLPLGGASLVTSGLAAPTAELQQAVLAAYQEVMDGSKQQFGELYQMGHMLGSGHYARVHVARSLQDGTTYAAKVLPKAAKKRKARIQLQKVVNEVAVLRLLEDHPCAVQLHQVLQDQQKYYIIMEHCSGGELFDYAYKLDHLPEAEAAYYTAQLASFLAYAHAKHIVHRDIKPENMLLAAAPPAAQQAAVQVQGQAAAQAAQGEGAAQGAGGPPAGPAAGCRWRLKVIDYGCSAFLLPGRKLHEAVGTVCYVAPEVLRHDYDAASDMWSAGVMLYMLLSGYLPFDGANNEETLMLVRAGDFDMLPEDWGHVSEAGKQVVRQLLSYKPGDRPTAAQLLQNSWVQQHLAAAGGMPGKQ